MARWHVSIGLTLLLAIGASWPRDAAAQSIDQLVAQVADLKRAGKYAEAIPLADRALAIREGQFGRDHLLVAASLTDLGDLYWWLDRYDQAEPFYKRALAIQEKTFGRNHINLATTLNDLGLTHYWQKRYADAETIYKRLLVIREKALGPNHIDVASTLTNLGDVYYYWQFRYPEAEAHYRRALGIREARLGDHSLTAKSLQDIADALSAMGRHAEAEPLSRRALALREKTLGLDHGNTAYSLNQLAWSLEEQGHVREAEQLLRQALAVREKVLGAEQRNTIFSVNRLAENLQKQGQFSSAEPLYLRALAWREKVLGAEHLDVARTLLSLGTLYVWQSLFGEAEPLIRRGVAIQEKLLAPDDPNLGLGLSRLAKLLMWKDQYAEAEALFKRVLAIREKALGPNHPDVAESLVELADFLQRDDLRTAEGLYKRALYILEKASGPDSPHLVNSLSGLAYLYYWQDRYSEAEPLYKRCLEIYERTLGEDHPNVAFVLTQLGDVYFYWKSPPEAEKFYRRAMAIREKAFGLDHYYVANSAANLAWIYRSQRRYAEAEALFLRSLAIHEKTFGADHFLVGGDLNQLGDLYERQGDWSKAASYWQRSSDIVVRSARRGGETVGRAPTSKAKSETERASSRFSKLVKVSYRLPAWQQDRNPEFAAAVFRTAQWAQSSEAAAALAQMAVRSAKGESSLARLVRERQDLIAEWQAKDRQLVPARSEPPARRNAALEQALSARLSAIDARIAEIDRTLARDFPDYSALARPEPLELDAVQARLGDDETLVFFLVTADAWSAPEETFIWTVTKTAVRWVRSDIGTKTLKTHVDALRCGLDHTTREDASAWPDEKRKSEQLARRAKCQELTGEIAKSLPNGSLPFDLKRAHELYRALFNGIEDLIADKHVLIVPSGPLTALPLNVLLTKVPDCVALTAKCLSTAEWLGTSHLVKSLAVLPAVSSLTSLRGRDDRMVQQSKATKPYVGFANPLLTGRATDPRAHDLRRTAEAWQVCSKVDFKACSAARFPGLTSGPPIQASRLQNWWPIPQTACEVCAIARQLRVPAEEIDRRVLLAGRLRESEIKRLGALAPGAARSELQDYRIVHFATHGAVANAAWQFNEPGLILTPPEPGKESAQDDGYLGISEVAQLHLDADWVILSACNTAAGAGDGEETLSGLASAFFYAGARAILVSHWEVSTNAAVDLTTRAIKAIASDNRIGRAEALRTAMDGMLDDAKRTDNDADRLVRLHPAFWGAFVLVGEGRPGR